MHSTKNYGADNGDTLVIGGKLIVTDEAIVEGLAHGDGLSGTASAITPLNEDADNTAIIAKVNEIIAALKHRGVTV